MTIAESVEEKAALQLRLASLYVDNLQNEVEAIKCLEEIFEIDPSNEGAIRCLKQMYKRRGDWGDLLRVLCREAVCISDPVEQSRRWAEAARFATENLNNPATSIVLWRKVLELSDSDAEAVGELEKLGEHKPGPPPPPRIADTADSFYWNTRLLDGANPVVELMLTVGHSYVLETGIDRTPTTGALLSTALAADLLVDGKPVTFVVVSSQSVLCGAGGEPVNRLEGTSIYDRAAGRCPPVRFDLCPAAPGPIVLALTLVTDNVIRASGRITLLALSTTQSLADAPAKPEAIAPVAIAIAALTGPPAELQVELTPTNEIVVSTGAQRQHPCRLASPQAVLSGAAIRARAALVNLSRSYQAMAGSPFGLVDAAGARLAMAKIGASLHKAFFGHPHDHATGDDLKRIATVIAASPSGGTVGRLKIGSAYQPFPWAVLYDGAYRDQPLTDRDSVDLACFWGNRLRIDRAIIGHVDAARAPVISGKVRVQACLNPHIDKEQVGHGVAGMV